MKVNGTAVAFFIGKLVYIDNIHHCAATRKNIDCRIVREQLRRNVACLRFAQVLAGHPLVRGYQYDFIEFVQSFVLFQIMPVLQNVGVQKQCFARTGRALEGQGLEIVDRIFGNAGVGAFGLFASVWFFNQGFLNSLIISKSKQPELER